jgi:hypothetical protein
LNPVASLILSQGILKGGSVLVGLKNDEFTFDVKKGKGESVLGLSLEEKSKVGVGTRK